MSTKRANGERLRIVEQIKNLRGLLAGLESCLEDDIWVTNAAQSVADSSIRLVTIAARLDAYDNAARDSSPISQSRGGMRR